MGSIRSLSTIFLVILFVAVKSANMYPTPSVPLETMDPKDACLFQCSKCLRSESANLLTCANRVCPNVNTFADVGNNCDSFLARHGFGRRYFYRF